MLPDNQLRVLVVEDNDDDAALLWRELCKGGFCGEYRRVQTEETLRAALREQDWDIVLSDFTMPELNGLEALGVVRRHHETLPFIFVSGTIGEEVAVQAMKSGAQDYVIKNNLRRLVPAVSRELQEARLRREHRHSEQRFLNVLTMAADAIIATDEAQNMRIFNRGAQCIFGYEEAEVLGRSLDILLSGPFSRGPDSIAEGAAQALLASKSLESHCSLFCVRKNGERFPAEATISKLDEGGGSVHIWILRDITERKQTEERLRQLAYTDALTGLPNRMVLESRLDQALADARRRGKRLGLIMLDLDRFKNVNDSLGHKLGDMLLCQVAERLRQTLRADDTVARLSGDEFAILLNDITRCEDTVPVANKVLAAFAQPFMLEGARIFTSASLGIAVYSQDSSAGDAMLRYADIAMYRAKRAGGNDYRFYSDEMAQQAAAHAALENALRQAMQQNELALEYQPVINLSQGRMVGAEALLRWNSPVLGPIAPHQFIPVAEETGLIIAIGRWVLRSACLQVKAWRDAGVPIEWVAVNLSARQLERPDLAETVLNIVQECGADPSWLEVEITESALMQDADAALEILDKLVKGGVRVSLDDFGTGYSSLSYLKRFPVDTLKIDRSFIRDTPDDADDTAIVRAIVAMAHNLGIRVTAEGVETPEQVEFLRAEQCEMVQGYFFHRPLPPEQLVRLV